MQCLQHGINLEHSGPDGHTWRDVTPTILRTHGIVMDPCPPVYFIDGQTALMAADTLTYHRDIGYSYHTYVFYTDSSGEYWRSQTISSKTPDYNVPIGLAYEKSGGINAAWLIVEVLGPANGGEVFLGGEELYRSNNPPGPWSLVTTIHEPFPPRGF